MVTPASPQNGSQRLAWYQEAKFGLFIHWGAYSVAGVEASWPIMAPELSAAMFGTQISISEKEYLTLPARFNPVDFDPDAWVRLAQEAGMRYIVLTSKHHDGFCMFDAPGTDYKITNTPYGKDICLELAQACARAGMPLGFYYSPPDMHHPGYRDTRKPAIKNWTGEPKRKQWGEYLDYMESHIRKLLTDYGEVAIIWFDGLTNHGKYDPERFHKLVHELSPNTLINDRLGDDYDFITPEQFIPQTGIPARTYKPPSGIDPGGDGFFKTVSFLSKVPGVGGWIRKQMRKYSDGTLELTPVHKEPYPSPEHFQPWETCMTMGQTWAHNPKETTWKSPGTLVRNLVNVVSRGGNYLLNVGPTARGTFPSEAVERFNYIGRWMNSYNQAIYGATYTPLQGQSWGQVTRKGDELYLHIFDWPAGGKLVIDVFPGQARAIRLFSGEPLAFSQAGPRLEITLPPHSPDPDVSVLAVDIDPSEKGWREYSAPVSTKITPAKHIQNQAIASALINLILNGLIAFFSYRTRGNIPYGEAAVDILITVFIIAFLTAWITVGLARAEVVKGNLTRLASARRGLRLPKSPALRALLIALACTLLFGGLFLDGLLYLVSPLELSNWAYIVIKTLYTGASGALASALTILSVVLDENRSWTCSATEASSN
jgi:alpha-L-fucosidase